MLWFLFRQNNSGGFFVRNEDVDHFVFIEAENAITANVLAKNYGIYFDGVSKGYDCECCGDRWNEAYNDKVDEYSVFTQVTLKGEWYNRKYLRDSIFYFRNGFKVRGKDVKWGTVIDASLIPPENPIESNKVHRRLELS